MLLVRGRPKQFRRHRTFVLGIFTLLIILFVLPVLALAVLIHLLLFDMFPWYV